MVFGLFIVACALTEIPSGSAEAPRPDGLLAGLIKQALDQRPELAQARADAQIARERVPQVQALPDPMLQFGVQNDSFDKWQVGKAETSWVFFLASQTFPFPGKLGLRGEIAQAEVKQRELSIERVRLSTIAEVRRAYVALQLARARSGLLSQLTSLIEQALAVSLSRYESGDGLQSDVLRSRLELARLTQQRYIVGTEERLQEEALNRLRGKPLDQHIEGARPFAQLGFPPEPSEVASIARFHEESPEYLSARTNIVRSERTKALAARSYFPDLAVGAGVMLRGRLEPMWTVALGVPLPVFAGAKQARAVAEAEATITSANKGVEAIDQLFALRSRQRLEAWSALRKVWDAYQGGILSDAEATADSTLTQYRVGKVPFSSVLEANSAAIGTVDASFGVLADAWGLDIAQDELSFAEATLSGAQPSRGSSSAPGSASTTPFSAPEGM